MERNHYTYKYLREDAEFLLTHMAAHPNLDQQQLGQLKLNLANVYKYADDPVVRSLCRLTRLYYDDLNKLVKLLWSCSDAIRRLTAVKLSFKCAVLLVPDEPDQVLVNPNMPMPQGIFHYADLTETILDSVSPYKGLYDFFGDWVKAYEADLADDNRRKQWVPARRGVQRWRKFQKMSLTRALSRFSNIDGLPSDVISRVALILEDARKPDTVKYAETVAEFWEMYQSNGPSSCMVTSSSHAERWRNMGNSLRVSPPSFYAYYPYTKGAYMMRNGSVVARCLLFRRPDSDDWHAGRIYTVGLYGDRFIDALRRDGVRVQDADFWDGFSSDWGDFREYAKFDIPAVEYDGEYFLPVPYQDHIRGPMFAKFIHDKETNTRHFSVIVDPYDDDDDDDDGSHSVPKGYVQVDVQTTRGFMPSSEFTYVSCASCGTRVRGTDYTTVDGTRFCSESCMRRSGYVVAIDSSGNYRGVPRTECYEDPLSGSMYTNIAAAVANGLVPIRQSPFEQLEYPAISRNMICTLADGQRVALDVYHGSIVNTFGRDWQHDQSMHADFPLEAERARSVELEDFSALPYLAPFMHALDGFLPANMNLPNRFDYRAFIPAASRNDLPYLPSDFPPDELPTISFEIAA